MDLPQKEINENELSYLWKVGQLKEAGLLKEDWPEIAAAMNKLYRDEDVFFGESVYRKKYVDARKFVEAGVLTPASDKSHLQEAKRELDKLKIQIQTEKLEYNRWLREHSRDELIAEKICEAITTLPPLTIPELVQYERSDRDYLLCFSDCHYGIEFTVKNVFGDIINEYSPEIFERRMWDLLLQLIPMIKEKHITELSVWDLGDDIQGLLRLNSQLMQLRYGVIESAMRYAEFMAEWLNKLSEYVKIKFQMTRSGNHDQLRLCNAPKNAFPDENMGKVIWWFLKERLKDNKNIVFLQYEGGLNWGVYGLFSVAAIHGETKNMAKTINELGRAHQTHFDYLIGGHYHSLKSQEVGITSEVLNVRSIVGVDPYGMSLNKTSNAGASLFAFEIGNGLVCEDRLVLK